MRRFPGVATVGDGEAIVRPAEGRMDFDRFRRLLQRMERSKVATPAQLVGCSEQEVAALEARYGLRLPQTYALYLRVMGHKSGRLFACDHMAVFYRHVL